MSMEKITKEELMEKFLGVPLTDDELEKVSGGTDNFCLDNAKVDLYSCMSNCESASQTWVIDVGVCWRECNDMFMPIIEACEQE